MALAYCSFQRGFEREGASLPHCHSAQWPCSDEIDRRNCARQRLFGRNLNSIAVVAAGVLCQYDCYKKYKHGHNHRGNYKNIFYLACFSLDSSELNLFHFALLQD